MDQNSLLAGLFAGIGYWFYPKYIVFTWGLTSAIEMIYKGIQKDIAENQQDSPKIMKIINKIPILHLAIIFASGIMIQLRVLYPHLVNKFVHRLASIASAGRDQIVCESYASLMMGLK